MAVFKDATDREWNVSLDGPKIRAVRAECNGLDPITGDAYEKLHSDWLLQADVLAILCRAQIEDRKLTPDSFKALIVGDVIDRSLKAFLDAQIDFSPSSQREVLRTMAATMEKVREAENKKQVALLESGEFEAKLAAALDSRRDKLLEEALTQLSSATSLPESSE